MGEGYFEHSNIYPTRWNFTQFIYIWRLLYVFRVLLPPIIRSASNCIYSICLSHRYCYLPISWKSWNWFECAVGGIHHPLLLLFKVLQLQRSFDFLNEFFLFGQVSDAVLPICYFHFCYITFYFIFPSIFRSS
jgi:hypothetical protein